MPGVVKVVTRALSVGRHVTEMILERPHDECWFESTLAKTQQDSIARSRQCLTLIPWNRGLSGVGVPFAKSVLFGDFPLHIQGQT